jgi:hypothetical protein
MTREPTSLELPEKAEPEQLENEPIPDSDQFGTMWSQKDLEKKYADLVDYG